MGSKTKRGERSSSNSFETEVQDLKKPRVTDETIMAFKYNGENDTDGDRTSLEKIASAISVMIKEMTDNFSKLYEEMSSAVR